jgi:hypothetical protein
MKKSRENLNFIIALQIKGNSFIQILLSKI